MVSVESQLRERREDCERCGEILLLRVPFIPRIVPFFLGSKGGT